MSIANTPAVSCGRCGDHKHRAELLLKSNELLRQQRDEWESRYQELAGAPYTARDEALQKEIDSLRSDRNEWERAHDYLIGDGFAWVAEVEMALDPEAHEDETYADCMERLLEELRDLRKLRQAGVRA